MRGGPARLEHERMTQRRRSELRRLRLRNWPLKQGHSCRCPNSNPVLGLRAPALLARGKVLSCEAWDPAA
jgi:hypothetical protein